MRRLSGRGTAIVASAVIVVGAAGPVGAASSSSPAPTGLPPLADVPLFRVNTTANAIQPGPGPTGTPELAWKASIGAMHMTPILVDGLLIAGTNDGRLVALDARTGETRWDTALGGGADPARRSPRSDGLVFASDGSAIHAVEIATGIERWSQPLDRRAVPPERRRRGRLRRHDERRRGLRRAERDRGLALGRGPVRRRGPGRADRRRGGLLRGRGWAGVSRSTLRTGDVRWALQTISTAVASGQVVGDTFYVSTNQGDAPEAGR